MFDFESYRSANATKKPNELDYLYFVIDHFDLPTDIIKLTINLCNPEFIIKDKYIYIKKVFDETKYKESLSYDYQKLLPDDHMSLKQTQYWMNLISISNLSERLPDDYLEKLANQLVFMWNLKIEKLYSQCLGRAYVIKDEEDGYFITIN